LNGNDWEPITELAKKLGLRLLNATPANRIGADAALDDQWFDSKACPAETVPLKGALKNLKDSLKQQQSQSQEIKTKRLSRSQTHIFAVNQFRRSTTENKVWKLSPDGIQTLVKLTQSRKLKSDSSRFRDDVVERIMERKAGNGPYRQKVEGLIDRLCARKEMIDCLLGLFLDDGAAYEPAEVIQKGLEDFHDGEFNIRDFDRLPLAEFLDASQQRLARHGESLKTALAMGLKNIVCMPMGGLSGLQLRGVCASERCLIWRAQIEQVAKATGQTYGITVFAIPVLVME